MLLVFSNKKLQYHRKVTKPKLLGAKTTWRHKVSAPSVSAPNRWWQNVGAKKSAPKRPRPNSYIYHQIIDTYEL